MEIPNELVVFFSELFNIPKKKLHGMQEPSNNYRQVTTDKTLKIKSLFQIMYYIIKNGKSKTPLHI